MRRRSGNTVNYNGENNFVDEFGKKALTNKITLCIITLRCGDAELYIGRGIVQTVEKYSRG